MENGKLIFQSIEESDLDEAIKLLTEKNLLTNPKKCKLCSKELNKENIGGFLPFHDKVIAICNSIECNLKASFLVMKHNGNGSPLIEK